jgi:acyl carrier protein/surfactin synthase thioesterase subunit
LPEPNKKGSTPTGGFVAPRNDLEEKLSIIWAQQLDVDRVGITDDFFDLGGDSLSSIRLIAEIKNQTGFNVPINLLFSNPTIEKFIKKLSPNSDPTDESLIVAIQPTGDKLPLFLIGGTVLIYSYFEPDQPLYKLKTLYDDVPLPFRKDSIEKIASKYIFDLQKKFPQGPYVFCGYSVGGLIAIELYKQLRSIHNETSYLFLLDPPPPKDVIINNPLYDKITNSIYENPLSAMILAIRSVFYLTWRKLKHICFYLLFKTCELTNFSFPQVWRERYAYAQYLSAANNYSAESCEAMVSHCLTDRKLKNIEIDWSKLFNGPTKTYIIGGTNSHLDLVENDEFIKIWVRHLNEFLSKVQNV